MNTTVKRTLAATAAGGVLTLATAMPAEAKDDWTEPASAPAGSSVSVPGPSTTEIREVFVDDDAWEMVQLGLGVLAGATVVGAAAVAIRRREHHAPHPA
jgi:hypothetical protein